MLFSSSYGMVLHVAYRRTLSASPQALARSLARLVDASAGDDRATRGWRLVPQSAAMRTQGLPTPAFPSLKVPGEVASDLAAGCRREWLETNGLGSFAMGTVAGPSTRRYHAILCAATRPPTGRMVL